MAFTPVEIWQKSLDIMRDNVPHNACSQWLEPLVPLKYENDTLLVQVPSHFFIEQIEATYADLIIKSLSRVAGHPVQLNYQLKISKTPINLVPEHQPAPQAPQVPNRPTVNPFEREPVPPINPQLNVHLTFDNFLEGTSNRLARTAGLSIAKEPGKTIFNPLFVHGKSGVGKTHLLHAIGNAVLADHPKARVLYVSAHLFQVQYSQAYLRNSINDFIHFYQSIDVLLLDDVHELAGKPGTQNAFFHIFNQLHQIGRQIIFTSDRAPKDLNGFEERLLTRFKWGLTAEMLSPDYQLRLDILNSKIKRDGLTFPKEAVEYIARQAKDNVRDLEGITTSIMAHTILENRPVDLDLCREVVAHTLNVKEDGAEISVEAIEQQVCDFYHIESDVLRSRSKIQEVVRARQLTMYLAKKHTSQSLALIGEIVGGRNHATVIHACKAVEGWLDTDAALRNDLQRIENRLADLV